MVSECHGVILGLVRSLRVLGEIAMACNVVLTKWVWCFCYEIGSAADPVPFLYRLSPCGQDPFDQGRAR